MDTFSQILESPEELISKMKEVRQILFNYTIDNVEEFSIEISSIEDKEELLKLKTVLASARDLCNIVRTFGDEDLKQNFEKLEISMLPSMLSEVSHYIDIINQKEVFKTLDETNQIINNAMEAIEFSFKRMSKEELKIIDGGVELNEKWKKVINSFSNNFDQEDPKFISLRDAFRLRFKEYGFKVDSLQEYKEYSDTLERFLKELKEINRKDTVILKKYNGDEKFARIHKRIKEENEKRINSNQNVIASEYDENIVEVLNIIKSRIDTNVYNRNIILEKDDYLGKMVMKEIMETFKQNHIKNIREDRLFIKDRIVKEYLGQCNYIYS
jgi:type I site-specific deoxyribonuclease, hsdR family